MKSQPLDAAARRGVPVEKVTTFVLRQHAGVDELLLLYHPHAGIQLPAGTVEQGESAIAAAMREATEETALESLTWGGLLCVEREDLPADQGVMARTTPVYKRPEATTHSYVTATLRHGITVEVIRAEGDFLQVRYAESDRYPDPQYMSFELVGWVAADTVARERVRYFAWLAAPADTPSQWTNFDDQHNFTLRWHPVDALLQLVPPQGPWLRYLPTK